MTDNTAQDTPANTDKTEQQFLIQRIYLKDLSFEAPLGAQAFNTQLQPKVEQALTTETRKINDAQYEVQLKLTMTAKMDDKVVFLAEVHQAGLFHIDGLTQAHLTRVLNIMCPQILFPYARETVDSVLVKGSFPALMLPPVNFEALFNQAMDNSKDSPRH
ncbi:MAG: protein-export chaperone SecB [Cellvibrionaceae bacterium]|nr:protein-export chaperone SecB [Cellvibrionaceae bacterium]